MQVQVQLCRWATTGPVRECACACVFQRLCKEQKCDSGGEDQEGKGGRTGVEAQRVESVGGWWLGIGGILRLFRAAYPTPRSLLVLINNESTTRVVPTMYLTSVRSSGPLGHDR